MTVERISEWWTDLIWDLPKSTVYSDILKFQLMKFSKIPNQHAFICSKLTIETLEQYVKHVHSLNKNTKTKPVVVSLLLTLNIFHTLF